MAPATLVDAWETSDGKLFKDRKAALFYEKYTELRGWLEKDLFGSGSLPNAELDRLTTQLLKCWDMVRVVPDAELPDIREVP